MEDNKRFSKSYLKEIRNFDKKTTAWILRNTKAQLGYVVLLGILSALIAYAGVAMAQLARGIVDSAAYDRDMNKVIIYAVALLALTMTQIGMGVFNNVMSFNANAKLEIALKSKLFETMIKKDYAKVTSFHTGELMNRLTSDIGVITGAIVNIIPNVIYFLVKLVGILIILFSIDWRFAIVFVIGGAIVMTFLLLFKGKLKNMHKRAQESDGKTRSFMQESLASLLVIKVFNRYKRITDESDKLQMNNFRIRRKRNYISIGASLGFSVVFTLGYMYGLVWGSFMILSGAITYGILTEILALVSQIQASLQIPVLSVNQDGLAALQLRIRSDLHIQLIVLLRSHNIDVIFPRQIQFSDRHTGPVSRNAHLKDGICAGQLDIIQHIVDTVADRRPVRHLPLRIHDRVRSVPQKEHLLHFIRGAGNHLLRTAGFQSIGRQQRGLETVPDRHKTDIKSLRPQRTDEFFIGSVTDHTVYSIGENMFNFLFIRIDRHNLISKP